jgi:hypothetical protein
MLSPYTTRQRYKMSNYDVLAMSPTFPASDGYPLGFTFYTNPTDPTKTEPFWGKGEEPFPVDYQATSQDFWTRVPPLQPIAIMSFSRMPASEPSSWRLEPAATNYAQAGWAQALSYYTGTPTSPVGPVNYPYSAPFAGGSTGDPAVGTAEGRALPNNGLSQTGNPPDATQPAGSLRDSTLPTTEIISAINTMYPGTATLGTNTSVGNFVSGFMAYHVAWYKAWGDGSSGPGPAPVADQCKVAGHTHVNTLVSTSDAQNYLEAQIDELVSYLDSLG